jgi:hypothetical protein
MKRRLAFLTILSFTVFIMLFALEPLLHDHDHDHCHGHCHGHDREKGSEEENDCRICRWLKELSSSDTSFYSASVSILILILPITRTRSVEADPVVASTARSPPAA